MATAWLLDPLRNVPGPASLKVNPFWLSRQCRLLRRSYAIHELHRKYGPVVRIGPNYVSVISTACLAQIYGTRSGSAKGPYYGVFGFGSTVRITPVDVRGVSDVRMRLIHTNTEAGETDPLLNPRHRLPRPSQKRNRASIAQGPRARL